MWRGDTLNEDTTLLANSMHRLKFPRPAELILPDPSIKNARSRRLLHPKKEKIPKNDFFDEALHV